MRDTYAALLLISVLCTSSNALAQDGHCTKAETTAFSCDVGRKSVSVCASDRGVQYRYGSIGAAEMKYPATKPALYDGIAYQGNMTFAGGGAQYIRFINHEHEYVVYSGQGRGWEQDGLLVVKAGKVIDHKTCDAVPTTDFSILQNHGIESDADDIASDVWELVPIN